MGKFTNDKFADALLALLYALGAGNLIRYGQILEAFEHGEKKHGDDVQSYQVQIRHANQHRVESNAGTKLEHESGLPHEAHTIARLILAIYEVIQEWEGEDKT